MFKREDIVFGIAALAIVGLLVRYSYIMVFSPKEASVQKDYRVERGPILDRNGNVLAIQTRLFRVSAWKPSLKGKNPDQIIKKLSIILDLDEAETREKFNRKGDAVQIARKVSFENNEKIRSLIASGELPGVRLDPDFGRSYPEKELASHLIGFAGDDNVGLSGIEQNMNKFLNPGGNAEAYSNVVYGNQVFLTIDTNIQNFAQQASMEIMEQFQPEDGLVTLVADARTGEILAYVSMPEIDLNKYSKYRSDDPVMMNKPVAYSYEPGSVFKVFSLSSFLNLGGITPETKFYCSGENCYTHKTKRGTIKIRCTGTHKEVDIGDIIKYSCNTACYASDTVSEKDFYDMIIKFGFGQETGVEIQGETPGIVRNYEKWSARSKPSMAIGQEINVNAMQVIQAATAIANHGMMLAPRVVKKVSDATGKVIFETEKKEVCQVVSPEVADAMLLMMERASNGGTARRHGVDGVRISAKTGTAQVYDTKLKKYSDTKFRASCLAIFPTDDPQYIIYNITLSPRGNITTGAGISVPAIGKIANGIVAYKGIQRNGDTVLSEVDVKVSGNEKDYTVFDTIPDFTGASKKDLLPLFKDGRFNLTIKGSGWVYRQKPAPGTPVTSGMALEFELR